MKAAAGKKVDEPSLSAAPFESAITRWRGLTRSFGRATLLAMPKAERAKWIEHPSFSRFRVFSCGYFERASGHRWERDGLAEGILIYCVAGRGVFEFEDKRWAVLPGNVLYCYPLTHHIYAADFDDPWSLYWMHLSGPALNEYIRMAGLSMTKPVIHIGQRAEVIDLFCSLLKLYQPIPTEAEWLATVSCAQHILSHVALASQQGSAMSEHDAGIQAVIAHMETCLNSDLKLTHFAQHAGLSPSYFCKVFKTLTGRSPMDHFNRLKIREACSLLSTQDTTVKEVASRLGFHDPYYFSRLFKKLVGLSPDRFRQAQRGNHKRTR